MTEQGLTPEREAWIRSRFGRDGAFDPDSVRVILSEIDALRARVKELEAENERLLRRERALTVERDSKRQQVSTLAGRLRGALQAINTLRPERYWLAKTASEVICDQGGAWAPGIDTMLGMAATAVRQGEVDMEDVNRAELEAENGK